MSTPILAAYPDGRGTGVRETEWHDSSRREAEFHVLSLDTFSNDKTVFVTIQATSKDTQ